MLKNLLKSIKAGRVARMNHEAVRFMNRGDMPGAERLLRETIAINPSFAPAHSNLGVVFCQCHRFDEGLAFLRKAVELDPHHANARVNLATTLVRGGLIEEGIAQYQEALRLDPGNPAAHFNILFPLLDTCDWDAAESEVNSLVSRWRETRSATVLDCFAPFVSLLAPIPQDLLLQIARRHSAQASARVAAGPGVRRAGLRDHKRLRIGYVSADFRDHAVAYVAAGLFERHDRSRFEIFAYSFGADDGGEYRKRLVAAFDHFIDVGTMSFHAAAQRIASDGIDILVDLMGHTAEGRLEIFALRPAPIQVHYLGFPGTMGADFIDYTVADRTVIPESDARWYTEKVVWMPASYQVNDDRQRIADTVMRRSGFGLPEGFVFCAFNKHAKIERSLFDLWLRILAGVPGSVLWLAGGSGEKRLRARASRQGIDPERLIFAKKLPLPEHLARHRLADLFLDTYTYNGHATSSHALWAGLPLLTCPATGFAGRVAASLLKAIGLPELIAMDLAAYEQQAIALARSPERLHALKGRLDANRLTLPLFDTGRFTRDLERAYENIWARHAAGALPQSFAVG